VEELILKKNDFGDQSNFLITMCLIRGIIKFKEPGPNQRPVTAATSIELLIKMI